MADLTVSANVDSLLACANNAAMLAALGTTALATTTPGTGVATFLTTPSSANLRSAITDETGTGAAVFANTPTLVAPEIGAATGTTLVLTTSITAPVFTGSGTTPAALVLPAGTGSIPALPANSAGWAAPATGGTSYLFKPPATATAGLLSVTAPASNDGVLEAALTLSTTLPAATTVDGTNLVGYRGAPQNSQSTAYTTVLTDAGKCLFHPVGDNNARTFTIDSNANVAQPIGTIHEFINMAAAALTIAITSDTLTLLPAGTTGSRTLAQYGRASAEKITSTSWVISGNSALT